MRRASDRTTSRPSTTLAHLLVIGVALLAGLAGLTACSGDDDDKEPKGDESGSTAPETPGADAGTDAGIGVVRGRLGPPARAQVVAGVADVVERWVDRGFAGGDKSAAFVDFTKEAAALARQQRAVMLGLGLQDVRIVKRTVKVDILAPKGQPSGATARFRVNLSTSGGIEVLTGRFMLSPTKQGWNVFGFDVQRGQA